MHGPYFRAAIHVTLAARACINATHWITIRSVTHYVALHPHITASEQHDFHTQCALLAIRATHMAVELHVHEHRGNAWAAEGTLLVVVLPLRMVTKLQVLALKRHKHARCNATRTCLSTSSLVFCMLLPVRCLLHTALAHAPFVVSLAVAVALPLAAVASTLALPLLSLLALLDQLQAILSLNLPTAQIPMEGVLVGVRVDVLTFEHLLRD